MALRKIAKEELIDILEKHLKWLRNEDGGKKANLSDSDLSYSNLSDSDLSYSNLSDSDLSDSNLSGSNLSGSNLSGSNLSGSNLSGSNLSGSNLSGSNLSGSNLKNSISAELVIARTRVAPPEGPIVGWKKCCEGVLVKLCVPAEARRSNAFGRKCRAEFVDVLEVVGAEVGRSIHDETTEYRAGRRVTCDEWVEDYTQECAGGIHFYITKEEAAAHL